MNTTNDQPAADYATLRILTDNQAEEIERLLADKARLDWIEENAVHLICTRWDKKPIQDIEEYLIEGDRAAIDAARKEGQP
jgi:hypothetical protein